MMKTQHQVRRPEQFPKRARRFPGRSVIASCLLSVALLTQGLPTADVVAQDRQSLLDQAGQAGDLSRLRDQYAMKLRSKFSRVAKSDGMSRALSKQEGDGSGRVRVSKAQAGGARYAVVNIEFVTVAARQAFKLPGVSVLTEIDRFADAFVDYQQRDSIYQALNTDKNIRWWELDTILDAPPTPVPQTVPRARAVPDTIVRDGFGGLKGKGVIVAIVDTGVDFRHEDFITVDSAGQKTSRLLALWDTTLTYEQGRGDASTFKYPNGASIGTVFTRSQLNEALRKEARGESSGIPTTDLGGHGTACAGIAAGNGNAYKGPDKQDRRELIGVAPEADIIAVRVDQGDESDGFENSYLLNAACEWMDKLADKTPLVVSCSFGGHYGGHDGYTVSERHLSARFPLERAGRAIVIAAGNEGGDRFHSETIFGGKDKARMVKWYSEGGWLNVYLDTAEMNDLMVVSADPKNSFAPTATTLRPLEYSIVNPLTNQLSLTYQAGTGLAGLYFYTKSGKTVTAHLYLTRGEFATANVSNNTLVGNPGTTLSAVTVGSYDWNDNFPGRDPLTSVCRGPNGAPLPLVIKEISCYSSPGPSRFKDVVKPEIVAPGEWYSASYAQVPGEAGVSWPFPVEPSGKHVAMNGTSAATPYVAGIVTLMFQKKRELTLGEVRRLLMANATRDPFTTPNVPNEKWGNGKLDIEAVKKIFKEIK
jgi:subtilisin family serine protease